MKKLYLINFFGFRILIDTYEQYILAKTTMSRHVTWAEVAAARATTSHRFRRDYGSTPTHGEAETQELRQTEISEGEESSLHRNDSQSSVDSELYSQETWTYEALHGQGTDEEEEEEEEEKSDVQRKENASRVLELIEGIMDTDEQKLDQGDIFRNMSIVARFTQRLNV